MKNNNAIIIGAGSYGHIFSTYLKEEGYVIVAYIDDDKDKIGGKINGIPIVCSMQDLIDKKYSINFDVAFCSIGDNNLRVDFLSKILSMGYQTPNFIHSSVQKTIDITVGKGVYIFPNCTLMPQISIGDFVMISIGTTITHHVNIGKGVFISCGVTIGAYATIEEKALIGVGAIISSKNINIGKNALIGSGAVVVKQVPNRAVVAGNPAKILSYI